jgi:hypothetical protein
LAFSNIAESLLAAMKAEGAHICSADETQKLRHLLFTEHGFNVGMIGRDASVIAKEAGFSAPNAKILVTPVDLCSQKKNWCGKSSARFWPLRGSAILTRPSRQRAR